MDPTLSAPQGRPVRREFTHRHAVDLDWQPGPGQTWRDAPKARVRVFRASSRTVWFGYTNAPRYAFVLDRVAFDREYPGILARGQ